MAIDLLIRNATLVTSGGRRISDIAISEGRFVAIEAPGAVLDAADQSIDATGLVALPGVIDAHVHFREPGLEHEETWLTGTRAAVMGGVTTVLDMPNTIPPTDTVERAREKIALATRSAYCDFGIFGLLGELIDQAIELAESGLVVGLKAFLGPTTGGLGPPHDDAIRTALATSAVRVSFHAEDEWEIESNVEALLWSRRQDPLAHLEARPPGQEMMAIDHVGELVLEARGAGHIAHVSSIEGLAAVARWRERGADLTCEVTPHHSLLDRDVYDRFGGLAKVNPPIRGGDHGQRLLEALADGRIDSVASDHAPHLAADKRRESIWDVPTGFAGVETMLPLMLTEVAEGRLTLERLAHATSEGPARVWRLPPHKGSVHVGSEADLVIIDPGVEGTIRAADLHGKNNLSPFEGRKTVGKPVTTIVRGRIVVRDGILVGQRGWGQAVSRRI